MGALESLFMNSNTNNNGNTWSDNESKEGRSRVNLRPRIRCKATRQQEPYLTQTMTKLNINGPLYTRETRTKQGTFVSNWETKGRRPEHNRADRDFTIRWSECVGFLKAYGADFESQMNRVNNKQNKCQTIFDWLLSFKAHWSDLFAAWCIMYINGEGCLYMSMFIFVC